MKDAVIVLKRYSEPSKMDTAPYGTRCQVLRHNEDYDLYIQSSKNEEIPIWIKLESQEERKRWETSED